MTTADTIIESEEEAFIITPLTTPFVAKTLLFSIITVFALHLFNTMKKRSEQQHQHYYSVDTAATKPERLSDDMMTPIETNNSSPITYIPTNTYIPNAAAFAAFQWSYILVYTLCVFSDWLKGPYVYALYESYGFDNNAIAKLFIGGFLSSLFFGTFVGSLADKYGRRNMCLVFCTVYGLSALTKVVNNFWVLFLGRVLSGIATSLLFTAFESWMVSEHKKRGFSDSLLSNTFSKAITCNGVSAILAGVVAQGTASNFGYAAPFLAAIPPLAISGILVFFWRENYGDSHAHVCETFAAGFRSITSEAKIMALGVCQAVFEACIYIWVFFWTPCLTGSSHHSSNKQLVSELLLPSSGETTIIVSDENSVSTANIAIGLVFACFMAAFMSGGIIIDFLRLGSSLTILHIFATLSMATSYVFFNHKPIMLISFLAFEMCAGMYFAGHGTMRSLHIEEHSRSAVMNLVRAPMNIMVVMALNIGITPRNSLLLMTFALLVALGAFLIFYRIVKGILMPQTLRNL